MAKALSKEQQVVDQIKKILQDNDCVILVQESLADKWAPGSGFRIVVRKTKIDEASSISGTLLQET